MSDNDLIRRGDVFEAIYALHADGKEGIMNAPWNSYGEELRDVLNAIAEIPAVPQEMRAREFVKHYSRMCHTINRCTQCPIFAEATKENPIKSCWFWVRDNTEKAVSIVEQWAAEHPEKRHKTYAEDFFEKFPKAEPKYYDGRGKEQMIPIPCRQHCYGVVGQKCNGIGCSCSACWNEIMEGEDE